MFKSVLFFPIFPLSFFRDFKDLASAGIVIEARPIQTGRAMNVQV